MAQSIGSGWCGGFVGLRRRARLWRNADVIARHGLTPDIARQTVLRRYEMNGAARNGALGRGGVVVDYLLPGLGGHADMVPRIHLSPDKSLFASSRRGRTGGCRLSRLRRDALSRHVSKTGPAESIGWGKGIVVATFNLEEVGRAFDPRSPRLGY